MTRGSTGSGAEADELKPMVGIPRFGVARDLSRVVQNDCAVEVDGDAYSVPWRFIGERVRLTAAAAQSSDRASAAPTSAMGFNFAAQPSIDAKQIRDLAAGWWDRQWREPAAVGPDRAGKTYLVIVFGREAILAGYATLFVPATTLVAHLAKGHAEGRLEERLMLLATPKLLVVNELGYLPFEPNAAHLFFQLVSPALHTMAHLATIAGMTAADREVRLEPNRAKSRSARPISEAGIFWRRTVRSYAIDLAETEDCSARQIRSLQAASGPRRQPGVASRFTVWSQGANGIAVARLTPSRFS